MSSPPIKLVYRMVSSFLPVDLNMSAACRACVRSLALTQTLMSML